MKTPLWKKIVAGITVAIALGLSVDLWKESRTVNPERTLQGGTARFSPKTLNAPPGLEGITFLLDNGSANRLHSRRNARLLDITPELFGPDRPFRPLMVLEASGPGNLLIRGDGPTGVITLPIPKGNYTIEVYPEFLMKELTKGEPGDKENLIFEFEPAKGRKKIVAKETLTWSGPCEIFLSSKNLGDLAALLTNITLKEKPEIETPEELLNFLTKEIKERSLVAESDSATTGWQKLKTDKELLPGANANCLDLALLTAEHALQQGLSPTLIANSGHALCAVAPKGAPLEKATFFEATNYLKAPESRETKDPELKDSEPTGTVKKNPEMPAPNRAKPRKQEPEEVFAIPFEKWIPFFRKTGED